MATSLLPWDRYLLTDRSPSEQRRIQRLKEWYRAFQDSSAPALLGEAYGYTLPLRDMDPVIHQKAVELGRPMGFGPLMQDDVFGVLVLLPIHRPPVAPFQYVRLS